MTVQAERVTPLEAGESCSPDGELGRCDEAAGEFCLEVDTDRFGCRSVATPTLVEVGADLPTFGDAERCPDAGWDAVAFTLSGESERPIVAFTLRAALFGDAPVVFEDLSERPGAALEDDEFARIGVACFPQVADEISSTAPVQPRGGANVLALAVVNDLGQASNELTLEVPCLYAECPVGARVEPIGNLSGHFRSSYIFAFIPTDTTGHLELEPVQEGGLSVYPLLDAFSGLAVRGGCPSRASCTRASRYPTRMSPSRWPSWSRPSSTRRTTIGWFARCHSPTTRSRLARCRLSRGR